MRVALVLTQARGGPVDLAVGLALEVARRPGVEVAVFAPPPESSAGELGPLLHPFVLGSKTAARTMHALRAPLAAFAPDVVHGLDRRSVLATATFARGSWPVVATFHNFPYQASGGWVGWAVEGPMAAHNPPLGSVAVIAGDMALMRAVAVTVTPSVAMARLLRQRFHVATRRLRVVPNGAVLPAPVPPTGPARTFISVGSFSVAKAVPDLIRAFVIVAAARPSVRLLLVGDGKLRAECEGMVAASGLGDRVEFVGYRRDVAAQLARADAFVLPSVDENVPLALLEAMGAGKACLATRVGGVPEALVEGTGLLVPPGDPPALAAAMGRLADEPALCARLGAAAAARAHAEFSMATCANRHLAVWRDVVASR